MRAAIHTPIPTVQAVYESVSGPQTHRVLAPDPVRDAAIDAVRACALPGVDTLTTRHSDGLDFHDLSVSAVLDAMVRMFNAGKAAERLAPGR